MPIAPEGVAWDPVTRPRWLSGRVEVVLVAALILVFLVAGWRGREPVEIGGGDDLQYLALSHSLEEGSYRELFKPNAPAHVQYPPAYPAWLLVVRHTLGENLDNIRATNLALVALSLILMFVTARRIAGPGLGLCLLLPLVFNPMLLAAGGSMLSEPLYLFLSTATLAATFAADGARRQWAVAAIALASLAFLTRSVGLAVIGATGVWLAFRRRPAELWTYCLVSVLVVGAWFGYTSLLPHDGTGKSYATDVQPSLRSMGLVQLAARAWRTMVSYLVGLPAALSLPTIPDTVVDNVLWLGLTTLLLVAGLIVLWSKWRAAAAYLVLYAGILVAWPWPLVRLMLPVTPLALLAILLGAKRLVATLPARLRNPALGVLVTLLTFGAVRGAVEWTTKRQHCDRANPYQDAECYSPATLSLAAMAEYVRQHSAPADVVLTRKPASVSFLSGRQTEYSGILLGAPPGSAASILRARNIRFVILVRMEAMETRDLAPVLLASCRELRLEVKSAPYALLLSTSPPVGGADDACSALTDFIGAGPADPDEPTQ